MKGSNGDRPEAAEQMQRPMGQRVWTEQTIDIKTATEVSDLGSIDCQVPQSRPPEISGCAHFQSD